MLIDKQLKPALVSHWMQKAFKTFYPDLKFHTVDQAPEKWEALKLYKGAIYGAFSLPVYAGGSDKTIYINARFNHVFRAWHDAIHLEQNLSFKKMDEISVAKEHCRQLRLIQAPTHVINAIWFDVAGQVEFYYKNGHFVEDQRQFVQDCLELGLDRAILLHYDPAINAQ